MCKGIKIRTAIGSYGWFYFAKDFKIISVCIVAMFLVACTPQATGTLMPVGTPLVTIPTPTKAIQPITPATQVEIEPVVEPTETPPMPDPFAKIFSLSQNHYIIPLTVRRASADWAVFFFELKAPAEGKLIYRQVGTSETVEVAFLADATRQMMRVDGLTPGESYQAMVLLGNPESGFQQPGFAGQEWGMIQFRTLGDQKPLRVGILGDASFGDPATEALVSLMAKQELDFVIHTGDVVYETASSDVADSYLRKFFLPFSPLLHQGPVYTVLGNHDYDAAVRWQGVPFYDYAFPPFEDADFAYPPSRRGNQYYALSYQDIQFLMLDTHVFAGGEGRKDQDTWLAERLADGRFRVTIPVFHVAPYSSSIVHPDDGLPVRYSWNWRFEQASVPLVFSGHFHHFERHYANGITYIVSGGGSSTLYAQGDLLAESKRFARKTHFVLMEIYTDHIQLSAIDLAGDTFDQAKISVD